MRAPAVASILALVATWLPGATPVLAASPSAPALLVTGSVVGPSGEAAPGEIRAYAWPPQGDVEVGETFSLIPVGVTHAGADGTFSLRAERTHQLAQVAAANSGYLNLSLITTASGRIHETGLSRHLGGPDGTPASKGHFWPARPGEEAPEPLRIALPADSPLAGSRPPVPFQMVCYEDRKLVEKKIRPTVVGELQTEADTLPSSYFHYGRRADSDISVAVKHPGKGWSISGDSHVGSGYTGMTGKEDPHPNFHGRILTDFEYGRYEVTNPCYPRGYETVRVIEWLGGSSEEFWPGSSCDPDSPKTRVYKPGHIQIRNQHKAKKWGGAVEVFGISLASQSGYSETVEAKWKFGDKYEDHYLCGDTNSVYKSSRIFAGPMIKQAPCLPGRPC